MSEELFDYTGKALSWVKSIRDNAEATLALNGEIPIYRKILNSAQAELAKHPEGT